MSIEDIQEKIKAGIGSLEKAPYFGILVILLCGGMVLGIAKLTENQKGNSAVEIDSGEAASTTQSALLSTTTHLFFGSKNGKRYYPVGCKSGNRISDANKIWFSTEKEAEMIGYTLGVGCSK